MATDSTPTVQDYQPPQYVPHTQQTNIPVPDPSDRTTLQLIREIATLREIIETRLDGMDRAMEIANRRADRQPNDIDNAVNALAAVVEEKFKAIETRFIERDQRVQQTADDGKAAIKAALDAAKEAVGKTEGTVTKQIDQIYTQMNRDTSNTNDKIDDLKDIVSKLDGRMQTMETVKKETGSSTQNHIGYLIAGITAVLAIIGLLLTIFYHPGRVSASNAGIILLGQWITLALPLVGC